MEPVKIETPLKKEWDELANLILAQLLKQTEKIWVSSPPQEFLKMIAEEMAEYRFKAEKFKRAGDLLTAKGYEDTLNMIVSQAEARAKEVEIHIKKGMLDFFKEALSTTLKFAISLIVPLALTP